MKLFKNGNSIDIAYMDLSKAFDKATHKRQLSKLGILGISGPLLKLTEDWQILGPLLLILYGHELPRIVKFLLLLCTDDTKIC